MTHPGKRIQIDVKVVPRRCIADKELRLYQYTAIDEYSRYRILGAYPEQSTYSSADFLKKVVRAFSRKGIKVECVQTDNGFEFTNRFSSSQKDKPRIYPQFCVNVKGWCKIKVDRGDVQGSLFAALIAMKQKSCSLSRAAAQLLFIYP